MIMQPPLIEEVKEVMFSIPIDSSPGPDGFGSGFYRSCWNIVEMDVVEVDREFLQGFPLPRFYPASAIVLIPKVSNPSGFDNFRPISLYSIIYKVCFKLLVKRLSPILCRLVSPSQAAFLPRKSIFENISLAQEMIHLINKRVHGGNVLMKVDMSKAYDSIDWSFLLHVMQSFGFSNEVCGLISQCIKNS